MAAIAPFLPQTSDPPPKAARSQVQSEPARHISDSADPSMGPITIKRTNMAADAAAKLLAPGFVDHYEHLSLALADLGLAARDDHAALRSPLAVLQNYMGLQPFKIGASGFSAAFDSTVLPRLMAALTAFLLQQRFDSASPEGGGGGGVTDALANECLLCLVNMSACDGQMVKMMLKHGVAGVAVRMLVAPRVPTGMLENAAWVLGNLAGDNMQSREAVLGDQGLWAVLGRMAVELRTLGYFPFTAGAPAPPPAPSAPSTATSSLLKICSWAMVNMCEGQARPPAPLDALLPVLSALMDSGDPEVQCHACWTMSHVCDGAPADISAVIAGLQSSPAAPPMPRETLRPAPVSGDPSGVRTLAQHVIGAWTRSPFCAEDPAVAQSVAPPAWPTGVWPATGTVRLPSTAAKLVRFLRHESLRVCKPALRAVGNIVCAEDESDLTQHMVDLGVVPLLTALLRNPARDIQKEVCWTLSNVGAGSQAQIQALLDSGCLSTIFSLCTDSAVDVSVRTEACWIVLNATSCGSERQIETLVRAGAVRVLCALMRDSLMVMMALEGLEKILQVCERLSGAALTLMAAKGRGGHLSNSGGGATRAASTAVVKGSSGSPPLDAPLEDVMLAEAKALLDTCKRELVERQQLQSSSSATGNAVLPSAAGGTGGGNSAPFVSGAGQPGGSSSRSDVFRKASKLWHSHFVSCELCRQSYSKASNATAFCEECRCNVCTNCDCSVFHLSYQLALLGEGDAGGKSAGKQKGRGKKGAAGTAAVARKSSGVAGAPPAASGAPPLAPPDDSVDDVDIADIAPLSTRDGARRRNGAARAGPAAPAPTSTQLEGAPAAGGKQRPTAATQSATAAASDASPRAASAGHSAGAVAARVDEASALIHGVPPSKSNSRMKGGGGTIVHDYLVDINDDPAASVDSPDAAVGSAGWQRVQVRSKQPGSHQAAGMTVEKPVVDKTSADKTKTSPRGAAMPAAPLAPSRTLPLGGGSSDAPARVVPLVAPSAAAGSVRSSTQQPYSAAVTLAQRLPAQTPPPAVVGRIKGAGQQHLVSPHSSMGLGDLAAAPVVASSSQTSSSAGSAAVRTVPAATSEQQQPLLAHTRSVASLASVASPLPSTSAENASAQAANATVPPAVVAATAAVVPNAAAKPPWGAKKPPQAGPIVGPTVSGAAQAPETQPSSHHTLRLPTTVFTPGSQAPSLPSDTPFSSQTSIARAPSPGVHAAASSSSNSRRSYVAAAGGASRPLGSGLSGILQWPSNAPSLADEDPTAPWAAPDAAPNDDDFPAIGSVPRWSRNEQLSPKPPQHDDAAWMQLWQQQQQQQQQQQHQSMLGPCETAFETSATGSWLPSAGTAAAFLASAPSWGSRSVGETDQPRLFGDARSNGFGVHGSEYAAAVDRGSSAGGSSDQTVDPLLLQMQFMSQMMNLYGTGYVSDQAAATVRLADSSGSNAMFPAPRIGGFSDVPLQSYAQQQQQLQQQPRESASEYHIGGWGVTRRLSVPAPFAAPNPRFPGTDAVQSVGTLASSAAVFVPTSRENDAGSAIYYRGTPAPAAAVAFSGGGTLASFGSPQTLYQGAFSDGGLAIGLSNFPLLSGTTAAGRGCSDRESLPASNVGSGARLGGAYGDAGINTAVQPPAVSAAATADAPEEEEEEGVGSHLLKAVLALTTD